MNRFKTHRFLSGAIYQRAKFHCVCCTAGGICDIINE